MNCANCGNPMGPDARFCGNCGAVRPAEAASAPPPPPAPPAPVEAASESLIDAVPEPVAVPESEATPLANTEGASETPPPAAQAGPDATEGVAPPTDDAITQPIEQSYENQPDDQTAVFDQSVGARHDVDDTVVAPITEPIALPGDVGGSQTTPPPPGGGSDGTPPRRRSKAKLVVALAGIGGLGALGWFAYSAFTGSSGGADNPEAAVTELADALSAEDPVAALAVMAPGEVRDLADLYQAVADRAGEEGFAGKDGKTFGGFDLEVRELAVEVEELSDDTAKVKIEGGTIAWKLDPAAMSKLVSGAVNDALGEDAERSGDVELTELVYETYVGNDDEVTEIPPFVMVVKRDGGWYVSPAYTAAEYIVASLDVAEGDFDAEPTEASEDADTPEGAIEALAAAISDVDVAGGIALFPREELGVLIDYGNALEDAIEEELDGDELSFEFDNLQVETEDLGDGLVKVYVKDFELAFDGTIDGESGSGVIEWDGDCLTTTPDDEDEDPSEACLPDDFRDATGIDDLFVVMEKEDGAYKFSPVATLTEYGSVAWANLPTEFVLRAIGMQRLSEPTGALEAGSVTEGKTNAAGYAVYSFNAEADDFVSIGAAIDDEPALVSVLDPSGSQLSGSFSGSSCYGGCLWQVPESGEYVVTVTGDAFAEADLSLRMDVVEPEEVDLPLDLEVELDALEGKVFRVDLTSDSVVFNTDGDRYSVEFFTADGDFACGPDCGDTGELLMFVAMGPEEGTVDVLLEEQVLAFENGRPRVSERVALEEAASFTLTVPAGARVTIELVPVGSDIDLSVSGPGGVDEVSEQFGAVNEVVSFVSDEGGEYTVTAFGYEAGRFTITATMD